jgi:hypothetical protein
LLGRIEQIHRATPDYEAARLRFKRLYDRLPQNGIAQRAYVNWVLLTLYEATPVTGRLARLDELDAVGDSLTSASARRDMHLTLADAYLRFGGSRERALHHLIEAEAAGVVLPANRANVLVRIGELSESLGHRETAGIYYRKFLQEFIRDNRVYSVQHRLADLGETVK